MRQMMPRKFERKMATGENSHRSGRGKHKRICQVTAGILDDDLGACGVLNREGKKKSRGQMIERRIIT